MYMRVCKFLKFRERKHESYLISTYKLCLNAFKTFLFWPYICCKMLMSYQLKLIKMRVKLVNLNNCAVPFLSRDAVSLSRYDSIQHFMLAVEK